MGLLYAICYLIKWGNEKEVVNFNFYSIGFYFSYRVCFQEFVLVHGRGAELVLI